jgi:hypothetical protein
LVWSRRDSRLGLGFEEVAPQPVHPPLSTVRMRKAAWAVEPEPLSVARLVHEAPLEVQNVIFEFVVSGRSTKTVLHNESRCPR